MQKNKQIKDKEQKDRSEGEEKEEKKASTAYHRRNMNSSLISSEMSRLRKGKNAERNFFLY